MKRRDLAEAETAYNNSLVTISGIHYKLLASITRFSNLYVLYLEQLDKLTKQNQLPRSSACPIQSTSTCSPDNRNELHNTNFLHTFGFSKVCTACNCCFATPLDTSHEIEATVIQQKNSAWLDYPDEPDANKLLKSTLEQKPTG